MNNTNRTHSEQILQELLRGVATALLAGATCLACGGAVDEVGAPSDPGALPLDSARPKDTAIAPTVQSPIAAQPGDACGSVPTGTRKAADEPEFQSWIVGAWQLCGSSSVFGTQEAGLLIDADGSWSKLTLSDGQLSALHGWNNEGSWQIIDTSLMNGPGVYQLNLEIDGSGTVITIPAFAAEPALMRLDNMGVFRGDYLRVQ